ncbi:RNA-binding protein [Mycolicibacterium porcinum]|uniref:CGNR zinc finger domain-containing protein n=1 Tax=Mycolicibacterium porcinum TaxID=39693 RepID=UPI00080B2CDC|nr:CGNR zinc finger domain-containing protein [Mycolicibacterium porcinum]OCB14539.1 RNA-binding protein [Mycolicibacterium porcinum]
MAMAHDTEFVLRAACVLANTGRTHGDQLTEQSQLDEYLTEFGMTGHRDHDDRELQAVRKLRVAVGRIWAAAPEDERAVELVNALLRQTRATPWLTRHAEMPQWHLHLAAPDAPLATRLGAEMAMAFADLIRADELRRLKLCAAPECDAVLIDLSRNRSRIFCDTGNCANRQHVAAYRARHTAIEVCAR